MHHWVVIELHWFEHRLCKGCLIGGSRTALFFSTDTSTRAQLDEPATGNPYFYLGLSAGAMV